LKLITDLKENRKHELKENGSYEWWYFDAIDNTNEYSFVAIFLTGNPFSPDYSEKIKFHTKYPDFNKPNPMNFCALSFNLYFKNRIIYRTLHEYKKENFNIDQEDGSIHLKKSSFKYDEENKTYLLNINITSPNAHERFKGDFEFKVNTESEIIIDNSLNASDETHNWLPSATDCNVTGKLKIYRNSARRKTEFSGRGYHDHNWGNESLFQNMSDWYWGRVISNEYSLIYFYIKYSDKEKEPFKKLLLFKNNILITQKNDFKINFNLKKNYWLLNYNELMEIEADDLKLIVNNSDKIDNGPFYIRFLSDFYLSLNNEVIIDDKRGFSEYINTKRLSSGILKPFVNMRIKKVD